jgi:hypothetical protein
MLPSEFGFGEAGMRYHERMWTTIASCKKQQRSVFMYLHGLAQHGSGAIIRF